MKGLFKHFMLIALLILHTSWGSVMAVQMLTAELSMGSVDSSLLAPIENTKNTIATIDSNAEAPCPHHAKNMAANISTDMPSISHCDGHDCCNCVNVLSSIASLSLSLSIISTDGSDAIAFMNTVFPDSPPSFILRPPIS